MKAPTRRLWLRWVMTTAVLGSCTWLPHANARADEQREIAGVNWQGEFQPGGLIRAQVPAGSLIRLNGRSVKVGSNGDVLIGFGRDAELKQQLEIQVGKQPPLRESTLSLQPRTYTVQKIEGLPQKTVTPAQSSLKRIRADVQAVVKARQQANTVTGYRQDFIWPVSGPITGVYGSQRVLNGEPKRPHFGLDIAAAAGTPVIAPAAGVITLVEDLYYSGWTIVIDHGLGLNSSYLHLSETDVKAGDRVDQGQQIGLVGATGRATGPHLCWRVNLGLERLDPQLRVQPRQ